MNIALKYLTALLGLWLIVEVSVFPASAAHWIAFATAIALTTVALGDAALSGIRRRLVAASTATATALLSGFLIIASLVFLHASVGWLMATVGVSFMLTVAIESLAVLAALLAIDGQVAWLAVSALLLLVLGLGAYPFV